MGSVFTSKLDSAGRDDVDATASAPSSVLRMLCIFVIPTEGTGGCGAVSDW